ncbi:MBL fold metallo-hydrolase [Massilia sp. P8910]|uniref:MBL fold metallo-hydrolase n=1 Tax=Massilia antarctica TaxID=2765360 RepID=UPI001E353188|nr:MBL fold metallo-hydrolase [Massilia antarctica]MCE3604274.1 MBL fold metallo-hydrolase [Massilia antarctica]
MNFATSTIACLCAAVLALAAPARAATVPALTPIKVSPHVYYFHGHSGMADAANQGFMSNAGFVVTRDGVLVFDALGTPALGEAMIRAIRKVTPQPVRRVIVSHYHADHFYGLQAFKARGAQIWAHERGRTYLASDMAATRLAQRKVALAPWVNDATRLTGADRWLSFAGANTIAFEMGGMRFRIIDMSGAHSPDDIMLAVDDDQVLFAGDLFFGGRIPFVGEADSRVWLGALDRMLALAPRAAIPGHGELSRAPARDIALTRDYLTFLRRVMGEAVAELTSFDEAYGKIDWSAFEKYPAFAQANRLNAYGTYLLMERESLEQRQIPAAPPP